MKLRLRITLSLCFIFIPLILILLLKTFRIPTTGQFLLPIGSGISILTGIGIAFPIMYKFFQGQASTALKERRKPPVVALDTNVLVNAFLYKHPEYTKEPVEHLRDDYEMLKLVRSGEVTGFVPHHCMGEARNVLYSKYRMRPSTVGEFYQDVKNAGVTFSLKRPQRLDERTVQHMSSSQYVHDDDTPITESALRHDCYAIVTDDHRLVKDPAILHYVPILYTRDFIDALDSGDRSRKELEKVAYREFKEHKS